MINFKKDILKYIPVHNFLSQRSYSQDGEDMLLRGFYEGKKGYKGFFVDVGAHHPYRFSNSMHFYRKGWRGINIEPYPPAHKLFKLFRPKDINLNIGISAAEQELTYYCFNESALNNFSKTISTEIDLQPNDYYITKAIPIKTVPLVKVLDEFLPKGQKIDFLTIDTEGFDLTVLQSNDWEKYQPEYVLVEDKVSFVELKYSPIFQFLIAKNYRLIAKTKRTLFFNKIKKAKNVFSSAVLKR